MKKKADTFIVTVDDDSNYNVISQLELEKYKEGADKAQVDPITGSKQVPQKGYLIGKSVLNPKYNPEQLIELLDLYSYHEDCVNAVAIDSAGIDYTLNPITDREPKEAEKERFIEVLENSKPSINIQLYRCAYDRRSIGYGAIEVIRESTSNSDITRLEHIPSHKLLRHTDEKRVLYTNTDGQQVWYVIYGKNYDENGILSDLDADTGEWRPYNSLPEDKRANEILWTMEYAPATNYYGRPPIIATLPSIQGDLSAVEYNTAFFKNYGMPKFAITVTGDFADYDEEPYIEEYDEEKEEMVKIKNPDYDVTKTLKYRISQQIREVIKHPHSAICITIPSEGEEGNVDLKITPLSVQTEEANFRMYRKDTRDEVIHSHQVDPSRLGIFDAGNLNGTNSQSTYNSYKYGTIAPIKSELEAMINQIGQELGVTSWKFSIIDVDPIDYTKDIALADFLFKNGAMTIKDLIDNFGEKFGLTCDDDNPYLTMRFLNGQPIESLGEPLPENNPYMEVDSMLSELEKGLRGEQGIDGTDGTEENNIGIESK